MNIIQDAAENIAVLEGVYLTIWTLNICPLTILKSAFEYIGGKGAISNISIIIIIIIMSCFVRLCGCLDAMLMGFHPVLAVERLREHWDDANTKVTHRKNQLDDMLLECRQFDEMSAEFDRWLIDVEDNFNDRPKSSQSIEALDKQIANHKVSYHLLSFMYCIGFQSEWLFTCIL